MACSDIVIFICWWLKKYFNMLFWVKCYINQVLSINESNQVYKKISNRKGIVRCSPKPDTHLTHSWHTADTTCRKQHCIGWYKPFSTPVTVIGPWCLLLCGWLLQGVTAQRVMCGVMEFCCGRPSVWGCVLILGWPISRPENRWRKVNAHRDEEEEL